MQETAVIDCREWLRIPSPWFGLFGLAVRILATCHSTAVLLVLLPMGLLAVSVTICRRLAFCTSLQGAIDLLAIVAFGGCFGVLHRFLQNAQNRESNAVAPGFYLLGRLDVCCKHEETAAEMLPKESLLLGRFLGIRSTDQK